MKLKMRAKAMAGADTTKTGEPDYAAMFNRWMRDKVLKAEPVSPDTLGARVRSKGLLIGGDEKKSRR